MTTPINPKANAISARYLNVFEVGGVFEVLDGCCI
jgi:hypothetical protein